MEICCGAFRQYSGNTTWPKKLAVQLLNSLRLYYDVIAQAIVCLSIQINSLHSDVNNVAQ